MNKAKEMIRGRIAYILYSPLMFCDALCTGRKKKNLKERMAPKPWYSTV